MVQNFIYPVYLRPQIIKDYETPDRRMGWKVNVFKRTLLIRFFDMETRKRSNYQLLEIGDDHVRLGHERAAPPKVFIKT